MKKQFLVYGVPKIAEEAFESREVGFSWIVYMETDLLYGVGEVWSGEGEVLKGTGKISVAGGVRDLVICGLREFGLRVDWGGAGFAVIYMGLFQNVKSVLSLVKEEF